MTHTGDDLDRHRAMWEAAANTAETTGEVTRAFSQVIGPKPPDGTNLGVYLNDLAKACVIGIIVTADRVRAQLGIPPAAGSPPSRGRSRGSSPRSSRRCRYPAGRSRQTCSTSSTETRRTS